MEKSISHIFSITPENLAETQYKALKQYAIETLKDVIKNIENEKYDYPLQESPAGDGMGEDNYYIPFYFHKNRLDGSEYPSDINDVFNELKSLKSKITPKNLISNGRIVLR